MNLCMGHQFKKVIKDFSNGTRVSVLVVMYMHTAILESRPQVGYSPKLKSPNIFHLPDLPNIMLTKFTHYMVIPYYV